MPHCDGRPRLVEQRLHSNRRRSWRVAVVVVKTMLSPQGRPHLTEPLFAPDLTPYESPERKIMTGSATVVDSGPDSPGHARLSYDLGKAGSLPSLAGVAWRRLDSTFAFGGCALKRPP